MNAIVLPAIWLIVLIGGLPQLSETVYTPALPNIAHDLQVPVVLVEYTLTIYLFAFALGILFWGKISDRLGRKPCILAGLVIFTVGCIGCYFSTSIEMLLFSRFIQAFGGSIGSVLGQAVCRDAFHGTALVRAYSALVVALAFFPAIGPVVGGVITQHFGWQSVFLVLIVFAAVLSVVVGKQLPETHPIANRNPIPLKKVAGRLIRDKSVIGFGLIVAAINGINFSYFAEGSFYLIKLLGLSPSQYGLSFVGIAFSTMLGGMLSKRLNGKFKSEKVMQFGIGIALFACMLFSLSVLTHLQFFNFSNRMLVCITIGAQMMVMFGFSMIVGNALALALVNYKDCIGTASSLFGFFYYTGISFFTLIIGALHDGTLLPMPLYFLSLSIFMLFVAKVLIRPSAPSEFLEQRANFHQSKT